MLAALISSLRVCNDERGGGDSFHIQSATKFKYHTQASHEVLLSLHLATILSFLCLEIWGQMSQVSLPLVLN